MAGRPLVDNNNQLLKECQAKGFTKTETAAALGISRPTLNRLLLRNDNVPNLSYSQITDDGLDTMVLEAKQQLPLAGEKMIIGCIKFKGLKIQRQRLRDSIRRVDPEGLRDRRDMFSKRIRRRTYSNPFPHFLWHIDGNHKLVRWKLIIHIAIDGFSRHIMYIECRDNNKAETVLQLFSQSIQKYSIVPRKIRTDLGVENTLLWEAMPLDHLTGSSVHNQRVERLNRDVNNNIRRRFGPIFYGLENEGTLNVSDKLDIALLHSLYLPRINEVLQNFKDAHNNHQIRTEGNLTPTELISRYMHLYEAPNDIETRYLIPNLPAQPEPTVSVLTQNVTSALQAANLNILLNDNAEGMDTFRRCKQYLANELVPVPE